MFLANFNKSADIASVLPASSFKYWKSTCNVSGNGVRGIARYCTLLRDAVWLRAARSGQLHPCRVQYLGNVHLNIDLDITFRHHPRWLSRRHTQPSLTVHQYFMIATWTTYADMFLHVKQLFELRLIIPVSPWLKYKLYNVIHTTYRYQILHAIRV